ncbi:hypothetical protein D3C72_2085510 [compost metagenome]
MLQGQVEAVAARQLRGTGEDASLQIATAGACQATGFAIFQRTTALLGEAQGFGEPEGVGDVLQGQAASVAAR